MAQQTGVSSDFPARRFPSYGERIVVEPNVEGKSGRRIWSFISVRRDGTRVVLGSSPRT